MRPRPVALLALLANHRGLACALSVSAPFSTFAQAPAGAAGALSGRLRRLVELVPKGSGESISAIADVGCDHALVARTICETRPDILRVYAVDKSDSALKAALEALPAAPFRQPQFLLGDGLSPLLAAGETSVHTIICAGMGCSSIVDILEPAALRALGVQRLVLQPWPSYLLPLSALCEHASRLGFSFDKQHVDCENDVHYVTTSFKLGATAVDAASASEVQVFRNSPLYQRHGPRISVPSPGKDGHEDHTRAEAALWKDYLSAQLVDLTVRLRQSGSENNSNSHSNSGRGRGRQTRDVVREYHRLVTDLLSS